MDRVGKSVETIKLTNIRDFTNKAQEGAFNSRKTTVSTECADKDHKWINRSELSKSLSTIGENVLEFGRFNFSQPIITLVNYMALPDNKSEAAMTQIYDNRIKEISNNDFSNIKERSAEEYILTTNMKIFDAHKVFDRETQAHFSKLVEEFICTQSTEIEKSKKIDQINEASEKVYEKLIDTRYGSWTNDAKTHKRLNKPHIYTPDSIMAKALLEIRQYENTDIPEEAKKKIIKQLQDDCRIFSDHQLKTCGMSLYHLCKKIGTPLNKREWFLTKATEYLNNASKSLSEKIPFTYLGILGAILLERNYAAKYKTEALESFLRNPTLQLNSSIINETLIFTENLFKTEVVESVSMKPGNVLTTSMAFTLYITGCLQLLISQEDKSKNSVLLREYTNNFNTVDFKGSMLDTEKEVEKPQKPEHLKKLTSALGTISIGLRAIMNGAFQIKDATPDNPTRDKIYNTILGKSFVPLSLIEGVGIKENIINKNKEIYKDLIKLKSLIGENLTEEQKDFEKHLNEQPSSNYERRINIINTISHGTALASIIWMLTDIALAQTIPETWESGWGMNLGLGVKPIHLYKTIVRPLGALTNYLQAKWAGPEFSKYDTEAFIHIACRLIFAAIPLILWDQGTTLYDSIAAMIDTGITVGEDAAASRSLNSGVIEAEVKRATYALKMKALENKTNILEEMHEETSADLEPHEHASTAHDSATNKEAGETINLSYQSAGIYFDHLLSDLINDLDKEYNIPKRTKNI